MPVLVTAQMHALRQSSVRQFVSIEGRTVAAILAEAGFGPNAHVAAFVGGRRVLRHEWETCRPAAGQLVVVRALAAGGGGGGGGKSVGRILAVVALIALTLVTGGAAGTGFAGLVGATTTTAAGVTTVTTTGLFLNVVAAAAVSVAGNLAINAIFPPPGLSSGAAERASPLLTGTRNQARPGQKIPRAYGTIRNYPDLAAEPWIEHVGKHTFMRLLFCFGRGPLEVSDLRIGNDPLLQETTPVTYTGEIRADGHYRGVRLEVRKGTGSDDPITLYPRDIHTNALQDELRGRDGTAGADARNAVQHRTQRDTSEFSIDVTFPLGLVFTRVSGTRDEVEIRVRCEYRPVDTVAWLPFPDDEDAGISSGVATIRGTQVEPLFWGATVKPAAAGEFDVRLTRLTPKAGDDSQQDKTVWTALRSLKAGPPVNRGDVCLVAMRIRASGQLNGVVDQLSGVTKSVLRRWTGSTWVTEATGNAAAVYLHLLTSGETRAAYADADVDMDGLKAAMVRCTTERRECNLKFEGAATLHERLRIVAATMRAGFTLLDGKPSLLFDDEPSTPVQHFCEANSFGFRGLKVFPEPVHGLRVSFRDPARGWEVVEKVVYADGYNADGSGGLTAATKFDSMEFPGYTNPRLVWMDARYHLAVARLRDEQFELHTDFEHLVCRRGSFVTSAHQVIDVGLHSGRVTDVELDGSSNCIAITIEGSVEMDALKSYGVLVRKSTAGLPRVVRQVVTVAGRQSRLEFSTAIPAASAQPLVGDLVTVGELGEESLEVLVRSIEPEADLGARLTLVPLKRAVYDADQVTPPDWAVDRIAGEVPAGSREPTDTLPPPVVLAVTSSSSPAASSPTGPAPTTAASTAPKPTPTTGTSSSTGSVSIQVQQPAGQRKPKPRGRRTR